MKTLFEMLFEQKLKLEDISHLVEGHSGLGGLALLADRQLILDQLSDLMATIECRPCLASSKPNFSCFDEVNLVIVATENDDTVLPYIQYFIAHNIKFLPVWVTTPAGYITSNSLAREVLEAEFLRQTSEGFAKWDHGPHDFVNLIQALEATSDLNGCYVEVGCFNGSSSCAVLQYAKAANIKCDFYFFDVFEGFNYDEALNSSDLVWAGSHTSNGLDIVRQRIEKLRYRTDCELVVDKKNIISDELPLEVIERGIRVANLDVDLYEAVFSGLNRLAPHIVPGGILICEDYGHTPLLIGANLAVVQFMQSDQGKSFTKIDMQSGQTFLVKRG